MVSGGAVAAAAARCRMMMEEEETTAYSADDLHDDWEFKIVRSNTRVFSRSSTLHRLLQEEALAGWTMVEKFDDQRIRFKRPRQASLHDAQLPPGVDPYRVHFGMPPLAFVLLILAFVLLMVAVLFVLTMGIMALVDLFIRRP
jgi:hypothetical protein